MDADETMRRHWRGFTVAALVAAGLAFRASGYVPALLAYLDSEAVAAPGDPNVVSCALVLTDAQELQTIAKLSDGRTLKIRWIWSAPVNDACSRGRKLTRVELDRLTLRGAALWFDAGNIAASANTR